MIKNRIEAGKSLAKKIHEKNCIVLAIPRGGVIVGNEIAKKLKCQLDIVISKKITLPNNPEYAIGAITHDGTTYQSPYWKLFSDHPYLNNEIKQAQDEVQRRLEEYRGSSIYEFYDKTIILVDDGIATGSTAIAILKWLSMQNIKKIILAVPVMPIDTYDRLKNYVSEIITIETSKDFSSVGQFYEEFDQVSDKKVMEILNKNS